MMLISLLIISSMLWRKEFTDTVPAMSQLYYYSVDINCDEGKILLKANPQFEGFASAWFYVDEDITFNSDGILEMVIKVSDNEVRFRYFYRKEGHEVYFAGKEIISSDKQWQKVEIPLGEAKPFYSSNFPFALTQDKKPCLYIFIDNKLPGNYDVEIDRISVFSSESDEDEK